MSEKQALVLWAAFLLLAFAGEFVWRRARRRGGRGSLRWLGAPWGLKRGATAMRGKLRSGGGGHFEKEDKASRVAVTGTVATLTKASGRETTVDLAGARHIAVLTWAYDDAVLHALDVRKRVGGERIPALADGFMDVVRCVRTLPGFREHRFEEAMRATEEGRVVVLERELPVNARFGSQRATGLVSEPLRAKVARSFTLHRETGEGWISLDMSYEQFARLEGVVFEEDELGRRIFRSGPVQFGELWLEGWKVYIQPGPLNRPLLEVHLEAVLTADDGSYWQLRSYFESAWGEGSGWERAGDQRQRSWTVEEQQVTITYWYDTVLMPESGYCSLSVKNLRQYPEYLSDEYTQTVRVEDIRWMALPIDAGSVSRDFRKSGWVKQTPPAIRALMTTGREYVVWTDRVHDRIGFAQGDAALILPPAECSGLRLWDVAPARFGGYSELRVQEVGAAENDYGVLAGMAAYRALLPFREQIAALLGLTVELMERMDE